MFKIGHGFHPNAIHYPFKFFKSEVFKDHLSSKNKAP